MDLSVPIKGNKKLPVISYKGTAMFNLRHYKIIISLTTIMPNAF